MKWLPFLLMLAVSCKFKMKPSHPEIIKDGQINYNDTARMPSLFDSEEDSGYYRGYIPEKIDSLEKKEHTQLFQFLSNIINKKDIVLLNKETLSHSVFVDQRMKTRFDTLRNSQVTIISKYKFSNPESQTVNINGVLIKDYRWNGVDSMEEDVFDLDGQSFRHFSFKGKQYYYIQGGSFYSVGSSIGNVTYHLIYSLENKKVSYFETCRFNPMLFGDINGDSNLDYLDFDNSDFCTSVPYSDSVTIQFYSCDKKGNFVLQKDPKGNVYFIQGKTGEDFLQDSCIVTKSYWLLKPK